METNKNAETEVDLSGIKHRIMVMSGKGGVGKSTIAVNLAYGLALAGKKVGLLDADLHGPSVAKMTGSEGARASGNAEGKILPCGCMTISSLSPSPI
jgi:Mrp family chromosome partitioning ATPase